MPELCCPLCKEVMQDAVFATKCCFGSFCDKCIRELIITKSMCVCGATNIWEDDLVPNKTLRDTITRILGSATSSTSSEIVGSLSLVQDKESTRDVQHKFPSPTQSDTSRDQWISMPPLIDHSSDVKVGEDAWKGNIVKDEMHCLDAKAKIAEDVQEKMFGVAQWESFQDLGAKAYSGMPLVYDPYVYLAPFGGMLPQDPFTAQCYIMSDLLPRDLSELAVNSIGMNQGSRIEFGSEKAEIKKMHKIEPCNERNGHSPAKRRRFSNDHQDEADLKDRDGSSCKKRRLSWSSLRMDRGHEIISCT